MPLGTRRLEFARQQAGTALRGRRCLPALGIGLPVTTCIARALAEIDQTTLGCLIDFLLQQSRAVELSRRAGTALTPGGRCLPAAVGAIRARKQSLSARLSDSFYFAVSKIVESLLRRGAHPSGVLLACRWQPALSARWRILAKQLTLFRQYPTPVIARGPSYPDELELRSGRAGRPYAGRARPKGVLLACRERKSVSVRAPAKSYSNAEHAFEQFRYLGAARGLEGTALPRGAIY